MKQETSQEQWERIQRAYEKGVAETYPNPERKGCPGHETLEDLATRSARFEEIEDDVNWKHVVQCGPCYGEYAELRDAAGLGRSLKLHREPA